MSAILCHQVHDVWESNFNLEFDALLAAVASAMDADRAGSSCGVVVALDTEFPGVVQREESPGSSTEAETAIQYRVLRDSVDLLKPVQFGIAISGADGILRGAWSFNLKFDIHTDLHTKASIDFLRSVGFDFARLATEGIEVARLGQRLAASPLVGSYLGRTPIWVTFSGGHDLAYLIKILTGCRPLPRTAAAFGAAMTSFCPRQFELRGWLPYGSLDSLISDHGLARSGLAHTAGSDALVTLELFLHVVRPPGLTEQKKLQPCDHDPCLHSTAAEVVNLRPNEQGGSLGGPAAGGFLGPAPNDVATSRQRVACLHERQVSRWAPEGDPVSRPSWGASARWAMVSERDNLAGLLSTRRAAVTPAGLRAAWKSQAITQDVELCRVFDVLASPAPAA